MDKAIVAHSLVAAHADRVPELAHLYDRLEQAVAADGAGGDRARHAHRALSARIVDWCGVDIAAERRDAVTIGAAERKEMLRAARRAIAHVQTYLQELPATAPEHAVVESLQRIGTAFRASLPRADLVRFRNAAARFENLQKLKVPAVITGNEAGLMLSALERGAAPIPPPDPDFDPGSDFGATFRWGLQTCVICEPGVSGGGDLGLGTSPAVAALLGVTGKDLAALDQQWDELGKRWVLSLAPSHPFAHYPFVPRGRFCSISPTGPVRGDLESTGPIGWAAGRDVATLARDLAAIADEQPPFALELRAASSRIESAARQGHAVIGLIEHLPPEAEGHRSVLVDA